MKRIMLLAVMVCSLVMTAGPAFAVSLSLTPSSQHIPGVGGTASVDLVVDGLGDIENQDLGGFFVDVTYDPSILSFDSVIFGDPIYGDLLDASIFGSLTFFDNLVLGIVHLDEVSFEDSTELYTVQSPHFPSFTLATLIFTGIAPGVSLLGLENVAFASLSGYSFENITPIAASVSVPEPATLLLLGTGLVGLAGLRRKFKRA